MKFKTRDVMVAIAATSLTWWVTTSETVDRLIHRGVVLATGEAQYDADARWTLVRYPWGYDGPYEFIYHLQDPQITDNLEQCYRAGYVSLQEAMKFYGADPKYMRYDCSRDCRWNEQFQQRVCHKIKRYDSIGAELVRRYELGGKVDAFTGLELVRKGDMK